MQQPGVLRGLVQISLSSTIEKMSELASLVFCSIAKSMSAICILAKHGDVINTLLRLCRSYNVNTRKNAVMAIGGIASMHGNSTVLLGHAEGVVVDVMARIIRDDTESEIRRNAARNLRVIGCGNETGRVASRKGVLDTLSNSVMNDLCFGNVTQNTQRLTET